MQHSFVLFRHRRVTTFLSLNLPLHVESSSCSHFAPRSVEVELKATVDPVHFRDLHATLMHQMGLNQDQLSYLHQGRRERLTEVHGRIISEILA